MQAITSLPPGLPVHVDAPLTAVPASTLACWPEGTFLENLAVLNDGSIAVSVLSEARIDRVSRTGSIELLTQLPAPPTGLALLGDALYAAVGEPGHAPATLWRIDPATGRGEPFMQIPDASFVNGVTPFDRQRLLAAESLTGRLLLIDVREARVQVWLEDERLLPAPGITLLPGANGVKRYRDEVVVSSNGRALLLRVPVLADGSAGRLELLADQLRADDFAFDADGALYLATHLGHSVDRLDRNGQRSSLAGPAQGAAGSTACAFGREGQDQTALFVTTTGGILQPVGGVLQPARLLRLELAFKGWPLEGAAT